MSIASSLARGRQMAESLMTDTCLLRRPVGKQWNTDAGDYETAYEPIYDGPCWLKLPGDQPHDSEAASQLLTIQVPVLALPVTGTEDVQDGDELIITASQNDIALVGVEGIIRGTAAKTYATRRRFTVEIVS